MNLPQSIPRQMPPASVSDSRSHRCLTCVVASLAMSLFATPNFGQPADPLTIPPGHPEWSPSNLIQFADDRLTVNVEDAPLDELLVEIACQTGFTLLGREAGPAPVTIKFDRLPLDEGLRLILHGQSYALQYSQIAPGRGLLAASIPRVLQIFDRPADLPSVQSASGPAPEERGRVEHRPVDIPLLVAVLASSEDSVEREEAATALGESELSAVVPPLGQLALTDTNEDVREAGIDAIAMIGGDDAARTLAIALHDESRAIRAQAIEALTEIGGETAVDVLAAALSDHDAELREEAVEAVGEIGGEHAVLLLEQASVDTDESIRDTAGELLAGLAQNIR